jgi:hypothetical protein
MRIGIQELQTSLTQNREETRAGFDQLYRHVDGFVKLHETLDAYPRQSGICRAKHARRKLKDCGQLHLPRGCPPKFFAPTARRAS